MDSLIIISRGPLFRFCFTLMVLGSLRLVWRTFRSAREGGSVTFSPARSGALRETAGLLVLPGRIADTKILFSAASFVFHLGMITVLLLLQDHTQVVETNTGFGWPYMPRNVADILAAVSLAAGVFLMAYRIFNRASRMISGASDYAVLALILGTMLTGFAASRQWNPVSYDLTVLLHMLGGNAVLALIPFTRLGHGLLFPFTRLASEAAWRIPGRLRARL